MTEVKSARRMFRRALRQGTFGQRYSWSKAPVGRCYECMRSPMSAPISDDLFIGRRAEHSKDVHDRVARKRLFSTHPLCERHVFETEVPA